MLALLCKSQIYAYFANIFNTTPSAVVLCMPKRAHTTTIPKNRKTNKHKKKFNLLNLIKMGIKKSPFYLFLFLKHPAQSRQTKSAPLFTQTAAQWRTEQPCWCAQGKIQSVI